MIVKAMVFIGEIKVSFTIVVGVVELAVTQNE